MLVFTRKCDEAIVIGDGIEIRVLRAGRHGVRLGVTAPADVAVHRREVYDEIRTENELAARADVSRVLAAVRRAVDPPAAATDPPAPIAPRRRR